jgi:hypothetical protein
MNTFEVIACPNTVSVTGEELRYEITDGPKYGGAHWDALTPPVS